MLRNGGYGATAGVNGNGRTATEWWKLETRHEAVQRQCLGTDDVIKTAVGRLAVAGSKMATVVVVVWLTS